MTPSAGHLRHRLSGPLLAAALVAAVAGCMAGCESPLTPDFADRESDNYTSSLVARAVQDSNYGTPPVQAPAIAGTVRDMARVDQPGPATAVVPAGATPAAIGLSTATMPATTSPGATSPADRALLADAFNASEPIFNLSLQDAIARAMKHSLAIKVEGYNPALKESLIIEAESAFDPVVFGSAQWNNNDDPLPTPGVDTLNGQYWDHQLGIKELLPTGGTAQISTELTYRDMPAGSALRPGLNDSNYQANINLQLSQPLLRGFGADVNLASIYLAQRDQRISLETFRRQVITTVEAVDEAYQNLVLARTNVEILDRLVKASEQTNALVQDRKDLDATKASLNQAASALSVRRVGLLQAQRTYREASDKLKNLLNDPEISINENALINPIDKPVAEPIMYSTADCIETALQQRTEMQEARLQLERADIIVKVAKNDLLPKLDMIVGLQSNGLQNNFDAAFGGTVDPPNAVDFNAGVKLEFPLGNRLAEAALNRRQNERRQAFTQMSQIAEQVVTDVKTNLRELLTLYQEIQLDDEARVEAGNYFEGIIEIEDIRAKTPEFLQLKLDSQANLASTESALAQAIVNYNIAIVKLEQAKGTLLEFNRISLDRPPPTDDTNGLRKDWFLGQQISK